MKMKTIKTFVGLAATLLLAVSCASEDTAQNNNQEKEKNTGTYAVFIAGKEKTEPSKTRTSLDYDTGNFFWEQGDNIFVKDDGGIWRTGTNPVDKNTIDFFRFQLPGSFTGTSYTVFYPGKNGTNDQVTIATAQTQTAPATTTHFGEAGDCGLATANKTSTVFPFWIDHKAAYLVFQPYTNDALLKDCYLTKIEVISDNNIAGTYTLDPITKKLTGTGTDKTITLTTKAPSGTYVNGFPMTTTSASLSTNGAYMVIAPGYHKLQVRYWLKSLSDNVEGTVIKQLSNFNYEENNYYDMTADLQVNHYSASDYYMWDAQQNYWYNHLNANGQPDGNYPKSNADTQRWFSEELTVPLATRTAATCPNANECAWYCEKGEPHWDNQTLWVSMGHLYTGGMWFKKKANIANYNTSTSPDGSDLISNNTSIFISNNNVTQGLPTTLSEYFYLPALGYYINGVLYDIGNGSHYWSNTFSSGYPWGANNMYFNKNSVNVRKYGRAFGFPLWTAQ